MVEITKALVERRLKGGETLSSIARSFSISHQALSARRARWGCKPLKAPGLPRPRRTDGTFINHQGYVMVKTSTLPGGMAYTPQHILNLDRQLIDGEVVHHIDGNKTNNDRSNLFPCNRSRHRQLHRSLERLSLQLVRAGLIVFIDGENAWDVNSPIAVYLKESGVSISDLTGPVSSVSTK